MPAHKTSLSSQRALEIWPYLIEQADRKGTITYGDLAEKVYGNRAAQSLSPSLNKLCAYCKSKDLPLLPVLAVSKRTGIPGGGPDLYPDPRNEKQRVFGHDWSNTCTLALENLDDGQAAVTTSTASIA